MSYDYEAEKQNLFTERGFEIHAGMRDKAKDLLARAGAFKASHVFTSGDSLTMMAALDYMVRQGEIKEITGPDVFGQDRVFVKAD